MGENPSPHPPHITPHLGQPGHSASVCAPGSDLALCGVCARKRKPQNNNEASGIAEASSRWNPIPSHIISSRETLICGLSVDGKFYHDIHPFFTHSWSGVSTWNRLDWWMGLSVFIVATEQRYKPQPMFAVHIALTVAKSAAWCRLICVFMFLITLPLTTPSHRHTHTQLVQQVQAINPGQKCVFVCVSLLRACCAAMINKCIKMKESMKSKR